MGIFSIIVGFIHLIPNFIPKKNALVMIDGTNIWEASKSPEAKHGFYVMLKTNADLSKGKRKCRVLARRLS